MKQQNKFIKKFSQKTKSELNEILLSNKYIDEAKLAASSILNNNSCKIIKPQTNHKVVEIENKINRKNVIEIDLKIFFKTLSYREFLNVISTVSLLMCLILIRGFYSNHDFFSSTYNITINTLIFTLIIISNHIIYKLEHRRSNSYVGRLLIDILFIIVYTTACIVLNYKNSADITEIIIFIILLSIMELFVSFIKKFTKVL